MYHHFAVLTRRIVNGGRCRAFAQDGGTGARVHAVRQGSTRSKPLIFLFTARCDTVIASAAARALIFEYSLITIWLANPRALPP